jgi:hypothetical protein
VGRPPISTNCCTEGSPCNRIRCEALVRMTNIISMPAEEVALHSTSISFAGDVTEFAGLKCRHTVPWMLIVWRMCVTMKSSYRDFAPEAIAAGVFAGFLPRHWTASM